MVLLLASRSARVLGTRLHSRVARLAGNPNYTAGGAIFQMGCCCIADSEIEEPRGSGDERAAHARTASLEALCVGLAQYHAHRRQNRHMQHSMELVGDVFRIVQEQRHTTI